MNIIDISYRITPELFGFRGEPKTKFETVCDIKDSCPVKVSEIRCSGHVGTHVDAPAHYDKNGLTVDQLALETFIGPCVVLDVGKQQSIEIKHIKGLALAPRVLFKTGASNLYENFSEDFPFITNECIEYLASHDVLLIGVDTPSIDDYSSKDLPAHHLCSEHDIRILENLDLSNADSGFYTLVALPLKFEGLDASPVRAILVKEAVV